MDHTPGIGVSETGRLWQTSDEKQQLAGGLDARTPQISPVACEFRNRLIMGKSTIGSVLDLKHCNGMIRPEGLRIISRGMSGCMTTGSKSPPCRGRKRSSRNHHVIRGTGSRIPAGSDSQHFPLALQNL